MNGKSRPIVLLLLMTGAGFCIPPKQDSDAGLALFEKMEAKIKSASSIEYRSHVSPPENSPGRGTDIRLLLSSGDRARLVLEQLQPADKKTHEPPTEIVSDGKEMAFRTRSLPGSPAGWKTQAIPGDWNKTLIESMSSIGVPWAFQVAAVFRKGETSAVTVVLTRERPVPHRFKLGKLEKIGDRKAQILEFVVEQPAEDGGHKDTLISVWIDAETNLPLKREIRIGGDSAGAPIVESIP